MESNLFAHPASKQTNYDEVVLAHALSAATAVSYGIGNSRICTLGIVLYTQ